MLDVYTVVCPAREDVLVSVVVVVTDGHPPLIAVRYVPVIHFGECAARVLVKDLHGLGLIQYNDVVQAVVVHVRKSHAIATVVAIWQCG